MPGDEEAGVLPESDPRKYEKLHTVGTSPNYYNGMEMSAGFVQTPSGKDSWGHDIVFEFKGDDDFWLYVDKELVIDLGGIHSALSGSVNFATGDVEYDGRKTNLRALYKSNYRKRNPGKSAEIHFPANTIEYKVIECGVNTEVYDRVSVNGAQVTGESIGNTTY